MKIYFSPSATIKELVKKGTGAIPRPVMRRAEKIFDSVVKEGDAALFRWTRQLDGHELTPATVKVSAAEMEEAEARISAEDLKVFQTAVRRLRAYHQRQKVSGFRFEDGRGTVIEERLVPLRRVGLCIPGGRHPLASTVLMTAIPARLAGVSEIVMITPRPAGVMNPAVLVAARLVGVSAVYKIGGVQGVAALAVGTESVPAVDKIVGPGSVWVTAAKAIAASRGLVGIEALAGPSEVVVMADDSAPPRLVAVDLLSQAEHGADSIALLLTPSSALVAKVSQEIPALLKEMRISAAEARQLRSRVRAVVTPDLTTAADLINQLAPEHLEIMLRDAGRFVKKITNAASIFLGPYSPVPAGDYLAGANHVLPTGGSARFASPLGVSDFLKRQSITTLSRDALRALASPLARFAELEGLPLHGLAVKKRFEP